MAKKSKGRGTAAAFGLLLVFAGLVGGLVLYMLSVRRPADTVDGFARAPVGCTTTLEFSETGVFYVFEDLGPAVEIPDGGCEPVADPAQTFAFELRGPAGPVVPRADESLSYDTDDYIGTSVARVEIDAAGEYEVVVVGDDPSVVAAIGRDPDDGVDELRQRAIVVAIIGVVLGALLLVLAGRRSKQAATYDTPDGPGWSRRIADSDVAAPAGTRVAQQPVRPHAPDEQVSIAPGIDEIGDMLAQPPPIEPAAGDASSPWAPPTLGDAVAPATPREPDMPAPPPAVEEPPPPPPPPPPPSGRE